jgi:hypothetical protein
VSADGRKPDPDSLTIDSINIRELMDRVAREGRHICDMAGERKAQSTSAS